MIFGFNKSSTHNSANELTNVVLSKNNFKVVGTVKGTATNWKVLLLFGGMFKSILGKAHQEMIKNANLEGTSKAVINITYDWHSMFVIIFFSKRTVTVYGTVIEFTS